MKTIITALTGLMLTAATFTTATAAETKTNHYVLTNKAVADAYHSIVVRGDVDIILVQGTSNLMTLEGYQSQLENLTLNVHNSTLYVNTKAKTKGKKPVVYIPVSDLRFLKVQGNSNVSTLGHLQAAHITIELASECHVAIKSTGNISISEFGNQEYIVEKWDMAGL